MIRNHPHWNEDSWDSVSEYAQPPIDELDRVDAQLTPADEAGERPDYSGIKLTLDMKEQNLSKLASDLEQAQGRIENNEIEIGGTKDEQDRIKGEVIPAERDKAIKDSKDYTDDRIAELPDWSDDVRSSLKDAADALEAARGAQKNTEESQRLLEEARGKVEEAGRKVHEVTLESERQARLVDQANDKVIAAREEVAAARREVEAVFGQVEAAGNQVESAQAEVERMSGVVEAANDQVSQVLAKVSNAEKAVEDAGREVTEAGKKLEEMTEVKDTLDQEWGRVMVEWAKTQEAWNLEQQEFNSVQTAWNKTQTEWNTAQAEWNNTQKAWNNKQIEFNKATEEWKKAQITFNTATKEWQEAQTTWNTTMGEWKTTQTEWSTAMNEWRIEQEKFEEIQLQFNENITATAAAGLEASSANTDATQSLALAMEAVQRDIARIYVGNAGNSDPYFTTDQSGDSIARSGWVGRVFYMTTTETTERVSGGDGRYTLSKTSMDSEPVPLPSGGRNYGRRDVIWYMVKPGIARVDRVTHSSLQTLSENSWTTVANWTSPYDTTLQAVASFQWANMTRLGLYYFRLVIDGEVQGVSGGMSSAPLLGHGPRNGRYTMAERAVRDGSRVQMQLRADHSSPLNRQVRDVSLRLTYVQPPVQDSSTEV